MTIHKIIGGLLVAGSAYLAVRCTIKAKRYYDECKVLDKPVETKELVKCCAPAVVALAFACAVLNRHERKQNDICVREMRTERAKNTLPKSVKRMIHTEESTRVVEKAQRPFEDRKLFYDEYMDRYFESTFAEVFRAQYLFNRMLAIEGTASVNDLCKCYGISERPYGDAQGWSLEVGPAETGTAFVDFDPHYERLEDGMECCVIRTSPTPRYDYLD